MKFRIGIRPSQLAYKQAQLFIQKSLEFFENVTFNVHTFYTQGDRDKKTALDKVTQDDFFTCDIDNALLQNKIDIAIHSAKDLPIQFLSDLSIFFLSKTNTQFDALVSKNNLTLDKLPRGAKIGTSSAMRKSRLKKYRSDFILADIRGNIEERIEYLFSSDLDAIVMAAIALERLGMQNYITQYIPHSIITPHPLQGQLAVVGLVNNNIARDFCHNLYLSTGGYLE